MKRVKQWYRFFGVSERPHYIDCLFFGILFLFLYISFNHSDIMVTAYHGHILLDMVCRGENILAFYEVNNSTAWYLLPPYILFALWSIPVKAINALIGAAPFPVAGFGEVVGLSLWWYKLLPTLFYFASAYVVYLICLYLGMAKQKARWAGFMFLVCPLASFSQFVFGQYDSIGVFFELLMVYCFLQKKLLKASLLCMVAITFKVFPLFVFVPLLLLLEKRLLRIIGYGAVSVSLYLLLFLLFRRSPAFAAVQAFSGTMLERLLMVGINTAYGTVSFFALALLTVSLWAYFTEIEGKADFSCQKHMLFIPLFVYSAFFATVFYHPQWMLVLAPYLVLNIFVNGENKRFMYLAIAVNVAFFLNNMRFDGWYGNVDANLINNGIFPRIFGWFNRGEGFASLVSLTGPIPPQALISLLVGLLAAQLFYSYPRAKNIIAGRAALGAPFSTPRGLVWLYGLVVWLFAGPAIVLYFR
ncbi:MAG: hypothetical protein LBI54_07750 [Lachnospiraceae bacterium]|nr:hypothetical protein [Lachnospiraceae bacterium]